MRSSIEELYNEYESSIIKQKKLIEEKRKKLNEAQRKRNHSEVARLNRLLRVLYEEKLEMEGHAVSLREYFAS